MEELLETINTNIKDEERTEVDKLTPELIEEILKSKIKSKKADAKEDFNSLFKECSRE